ncbi:MAG: D-alanyl-D-alanine carboxypeptidase family protein [Eubacteriales bacterium]
MKAIPKRLLCLILPIFLLIGLTSCSSVPGAILHEEGDAGYIAYKETDLVFDLSCPQAFVYDMNEGVILYAKGVDRIVYPASTTKLLTILYALTILSPDDLVTPGSEVNLIAADSSIAYVKSYHTLSVEMLIEGMLLPSGNDAAYALAGAAGRKIADDPTLDGEKAIEVFMEGMNAYAREIGCVGTSFTEPDGYYNKNHYTTLEDLILISRMAADNEIIKKYAALPYDEVTYASGHTNSWTNTNVMLDENSEYYSPYVTGLKTGSASGGYHFICTAEKDGQRYLIGVFGGSDKDVRFADALTVLNELFGKDEMA